MMDIRLSQQPIQLREFRFLEDYPAAHYLWESAGSGIRVRRSDEPEEIQKKIERDLDLFLVAEANGKLITVCTYAKEF